MRPIHPLHSILLAFPLSLFFGALVSDVAYATSFHVQWINFSSWLIAGGLFMGAFALIWSVVEWRRGGVSRLGRPMAYFLALLIMWTLGFVNALVHANDAWATMPASLYLSIVATLAALVASWIGYSGLHAGEQK